MAEEKRNTRYSYFAQFIANHLADHSKIRRLKSSKGQALINGVAGHMEDLSDSMDLATRNLFLDLASLDTPDIIWSTSLPAHWKLQYPSENRNLLKNSSFEITTNQRILPDWWRSISTAVDEITYTDGVIGANALSIPAPVAGVGTTSTVLYQDVAVEIMAGTNLIPSCWYRIDRVLSGVLTPPADSFGLHLTATLRDGTTETSMSNFAIDTDGKWRRLSFTYTPTQDVVRLRVSVSIINNIGFNWLDPVDVDCFQLERSSITSSWMPHIQDSLQYLDLDSLALAPAIFEAGTRAQYVQKLKDFWLESIPTRVEVEDAAYTPYGSAQVEVFGGLEVDFWKNTIRFNYQKANYAVRKIGTADTGADLFADYSLAFLDYEGKYEVDTTITIVGITFFHNKLWVVFTGTDWKGYTKTYLGIVDPKVPHPEPTYLEVDACLELPSAPANIDRAFIRYEDQQHLAVGNSTSMVLYRLYYDYFMVDNFRNKVFFREDYTNVSPMEVNPYIKSLDNRLSRNS